MAVHVLTLPVLPSPRDISTLRGIGGVLQGSELRPRAIPDMLRTGVAEVDALAGGLPRGALSEIVGPASCGRTSLLLATLASATSRQEVCALVDASDAFDPRSAATAGVDLKRVLWVRCQEDVSRFRFQVSSGQPRQTRNGKRGTLGRLEQALRAADLLLQAGGFGLVMMDLADVPSRLARRVPLTSWFRFRRAVEKTPTALVVVEQQANARGCASLVLALERRPAALQTSIGSPTHARLLGGVRIKVEMAESRIAQRKPLRSVDFEARATWAG